MTALPLAVERELGAFDAGRAVLRGRAVAEPLTGGLTNRAWRVTSRDVDWVVRIGGARDAALAIDRQAEAIALATASVHGLAPRCVHAAVERGVLVLEYVPGTVWSRETARSPVGIERIGALLRGLHALPVPPGLPDVNVAALIAGYLARPVEVAGPVPRSRLAARAQAALDEYAPHARAFCHHDVHHRNVVESDRLVLVDWEYAGGGDPALDLAAYAAYHDLDGEQRAWLLGAYGRGVTGSELDSARAVFDCLQALWHDAAGTWGVLATESRDALIGRLSANRTSLVDRG